MNLVQATLERDLADVNRRIREFFASCSEASTQALQSIDAGRKPPSFTCDFFLKGSAQLADLMGQQRALESSLKTLATEKE